MKHKDQRLYEFCIENLSHSTNSIIELLNNHYVSNEVSSKLNRLLDDMIRVNAILSMINLPSQGSAYSTNRVDLYRVVDKE